MNHDDAINLISEIDNLKNNEKKSQKILKSFLVFDFGWKVLRKVSCESQKLEEWEEKNLKAFKTS